MAGETAGTSTQSAAVSADLLQAKANEIKEVDAKIAAAGGSEAAARKAVVDEILTANKDQVETIFSQVVGQFQKLDGNVLVGLVARLEEAMKADLKTMTDSVVDEVLKGRSSEQVDVAGLKESRKGLIEGFKALKTVLDSLGIDTSTVEEPKRTGGRTAGSGGGSTKSGANKDNYRFYLDGKPRPNSQNTFSSLAYYATKGLNEDGSKRADGDDARMSSDSLRKLISEAGIQYGTQDEWEMTLANGKKIGAKREIFTDETPAEGDAPVAAETPADGAAPVAEVPATV